LYYLQITPIAEVLTTMNPGIFLIQDNEELIEMTEQIYESEKLLQTWLA